MFYGEYQTSIDDKGRVVIPARLREAARIAEGAVGFMMAPGDDGCISIYTPARWREIEAELKAAPRAEPKARKLRRRTFTQAAEGQCDRQGRMRVPAPLLEKAGITREAVLVGVSDVMELWDRSRWESYRAEMFREGDGGTEGASG